jgi:hypothetical protein
VVQALTGGQAAFMPSMLCRMLEGLRGPKFQCKCASGLRAGQRTNFGPLLLQVDRLIMPSLVELGAPHFVHALVIGASEGHRRAEPNVEIVKIFQGSD